MKVFNYQYLEFKSKHAKSTQVKILTQTKFNSKNQNYFKK